MDFTQVHPEWGHATNSSMIVSRRLLTQGLFLDRRTFLQSYDPTQDPQWVLDWSTTFPASTYVVPGARIELARGFPPTGF